MCSGDVPILDDMVAMEIGNHAAQIEDASSPTAATAALNGLLFQPMSIATLLIKGWMQEVITYVCTNMVAQGVQGKARGKAREPRTGGNGGPRAPGAPAPPGIKKSPWSLFKSLPGLTLITLLNIFLGILT